MDTALRDMTFRGASLDDLRRAARSSGALRPLLTDGARKVLDGLTTVTEVLRVAGGEVQADAVPIGGGAEEAGAGRAAAGAEIPGRARALARGTTGRASRRTERGGNAPGARTS